MGYSKEELLRFTIADISPQERIEEYFQIFQKLFKTNHSYSEIGIVISSTNINTQVEYIYNFFKLEAEQKKLHFSFRNGLLNEAAEVRTDREKIYAILTNLVKNALKFTPSGFVEFGYIKKGGFLEFYVMDSGTGVSEQQKEFIFDRFRQGSESLTRNYEGAGLGLPISKAYVEDLGGKIWVKNNTDLPSGNGNRFNRGSTFYFTLPFIPAKNPKMISSELTADVDAIIHKRKLKILIAEDDKASELLFRIMLGNDSREFLHASNGIEAIESCKNNPDIDLVLMDINMPKMDGYDATRKIREFNKDVVIIAQTAYALSNDRKKSIDAGCNDYISKPIKRASLIKIIEKNLKPE